MGEQDLLNECLCWSGRQVLGRANRASHFGHVEQDTFEDSADQELLVQALPELSICELCHMLELRQKQSWIASCRLLKHDLSELQRRILGLSLNGLVARQRLVPRFKLPEADSLRVEVSHGMFV